MAPSVGTPYNTNDLPPNDLGTNAETQEDFTLTEAHEDTGAPHEEPILPLALWPDLGPRMTPDGQPLTESDEELLQAAEFHEALHRTSQSIVQLNDVHMNPYAPTPTPDEYNGAYALPSEECAKTIILKSADPELSTLLNEEAPVLAKIVRYIKDMAPHSGLLAGDRPNLWQWYAIENLSALSLLKQLKQRMEVYDPYVWEANFCTAFAIKEAGIWDKYLHMVDQQAYLLKHYEATSGNVAPPQEGLLFTQFATPMQP